MPPAEGLGRPGEQDDHPAEQTQGWLIFRTLSVSMEIVQTIGVLPTNIYFYTLEVELDSIENVNAQNPIWWQPRILVLYYFCTSKSNVLT